MAGLAAAAFLKFLSYCIHPSPAYFRAVWTINEEYAKRSCTRVGSRCVTIDTYALKHSTHCNMLATLRFLLGFSPVSFEVPPNESGKNSASSINSPFPDFF